jgi:hypothetical protein
MLRNVIKPIIIRRRTRKRTRIISVITYYPSETRAD